MTEEDKNVIEDLSNDIEHLTLSNNYYFKENKKLCEAIEEIKKYINKWQGLCFDEITASELLKICEVLDDNRK